MKSVYIHIPFCLSICSYCDFPKLYLNNQVNDYLKALDNEIKQVYNREPIRTLYIGGGTPSCLSINELKDLFNIINQFDLSKLEEFTIECNVNDLSLDKLSLFKESGVIRLSIGVQTFNNRLLKILGRTSDDALTKINLAKKYFSNISIDLIYGINTQTIEELDNDLKTIINLDIQHISTYSLILEEHTKLYIDHYQELDEDLNATMYNHINEVLTDSAFNLYEISNYAKEGYESKHNLVYWNNEEYYGFGMGASAYLNSIRSLNTKNINDYINGKYIIDSNSLIKKEKMENEMILGLRKIEGVNTKTFFQKFGQTIDEVFDIVDLINKQYLIEKNDYIYINPKHLFISNEILINFLD